MISTTPHNNSNDIMIWPFQQLPQELQVRTLSYLRAHDLSKVHQVSKYFWLNKKLQHDIVVFASEQVYPSKWTDGFQDQPISTTITNTNITTTTVINPATISSITAATTTPPPRKLINVTKHRSGSLGSWQDKKNNNDTTTTPKSRSSSLGSLDEVTQEEQQQPFYYTFEHLRNMELLVVARVLNTPEPSTGFVVSKSWCKTALAWLEEQQERRLQQQQDIVNNNETAVAEHNEDSNNHSSKNNKKKKMKKISKKERLKQRNKKSSITPSKKNNNNNSNITCEPPPPNINSDITCEHNQLQHYTSIRSARARRRILDKQAWKILKVLYPESTTLHAATIGDICIQCQAEACQIQKVLHDKQEFDKQQRKLPLNNISVRRFYTRTRGVPEQCLRERMNNNKQQRIQDDSHSSYTSFSDEKNEIIDTMKLVIDDDDNDKKMPATIAAVTDCSNEDDNSINSHCPLIDGKYYVLPRAWCYGWRRFMKTGEGGMTNTSYVPPDAASLLCDAHRMALLPPHLEAFLQGDSNHLLESSTVKQQGICNISTSSASAATLVPGQGPTQESIQAMRSLGLNENEINQQLAAMRTIEAQQQRLQRRQAIAATEDVTTAISRNEMLDRENHSVVEIVTQDEFNAIEACWPGTTVFALHFTVGRTTSSSASSSVNFGTPVCRSCDATGRRCSVSIKNRARNWVKRSAEKARAPASLEY